MVAITPEREAGHPRFRCSGRGRARKHWTHFTHDEQTLLMTLWCISRSPLLAGGNLPDNDDFTLSLLSNDEVLAVDERREVRLIRDVEADGQRPGDEADDADRARHRAGAERSVSGHNAAWWRSNVECAARPLRRDVFDWTW